MTALTVSRTRTWAPFTFAPYLLVVVLHLGAKSIGWTDLDHWTKPLLLPALAIPIVVLGRRGPIAPLAALLGGVLLSWLGDVTVENLPVGLGFFLLAHVAYLLAFTWGYRHRIPRWTLVYVVWWVALMAVLLPHLGAMLVPVAVYGLALGGMAAVAARGGVVPAVGGALFAISDSLLAVRLFTPLLQDRLSDVVIMTLYVAAQALLVIGMLRRFSPRAGVPRRG
jgi:uncharacterized membrane protein YhhN